MGDRVDLGDDRQVRLPTPRSKIKLTHYQPGGAMAAGVTGHVWTLTAIAAVLD
jgi:hypothetical protein